MSTQSTNIRIDTELKRQAQQLFSDLGMDMTTAVNIFLHQAVREQAIPFRIGEPARPNAETLEAIAEMREMLAGSIPVKQLKLVLAWIVLHEEELYAAWNKAVRNLPIDKIEPLK